MPVQSFVKLLRPDSIALIGASARPGSVGQVVLSNILSGGFGGRIYAVNPNRLSVEGVTWAASIDVLPAVPDLAVIVTPARDIVDIVNRLGKLGTKMAVVITAGITVGNGLRADMLAAAASHGMRLIGPNCVGALMPHVRLNASFSSVPALPGHVAMISQSGALITAILDTAAQRGLGFSCIVSVGDMADTDLADLIDVFAADPGTTAILLYVEGISATAKFMSAARAAVKIKPVIAIKAGRNAAGARAALSHTGSLAGADDVYRCAFARAGIITVETLTELFDAAEVFAAPCSIGGNRLAIVTNGGGAGILAVDALGASGTVAQLSAATLARLDAVLPVDWSHGNPIDVIGDGRVDRYRAAVDITLHDEGVDAVLVMNCPTGLSPLAEIADAVAAAVVAARAAGSRKPVLACWLGETNRAAAQTAFAGARIPLFATPEEAVRSFELMVAAMAARHRLTMADTAPAVPDEARAAALAIIADARADGRTLLDEVESKHLLAAYGVPVVPTRLARSLETVAVTCKALLPPYAVKIVSPDIPHKSDVGGVVLNLDTVEAAVAAATTMQARIAVRLPHARITGYAVQTMCVRPGAFELIAGIADDAAFGPVLMVGAGGTSVAVVNDKALGLPPLGESGARQMIAATRVSKLLAGYRDRPAVCVDAVARVLAVLSAIAVDLPDVLELDINPLLVDTAGVVALDARIVITEAANSPSRLVIRTAPADWAASLVTRTGFSFDVRPVHSDDEKVLAEFFTHVTPEDLRFRFLTSLRDVGHDRLAAMTQIDYRRDMTFLAFEGDGQTVIAVATLAGGADHDSAEIALSMRSDMKHRGVSWTLLDHVLRFAGSEGIETVVSVESADHIAAIALEREMGFSVACDEDPTRRIVSRKLAPRYVPTDTVVE